MREKVWYNLLDCKFKVFYFQELFLKYQVIERRLNIFLGLTSSGSIASWAIWNELHFIWVLLIATSTIIFVIKPYFPFHKYRTDIDKVSTALEKLQLEYEKLWFQVDTDGLDDKEIFNRFIYLQSEKNKILKFSDDTILKDDKKIEKKANQQMDSYLLQNYNIKHIS